MDRGKRRNLALVCTAALGASIACAQEATLPTGAALREAVRRELRNMPALMRCYTFADLKAEGLTFAPGKANGSFDTGPGRWPEQKAVKLDRGWLQGPAAEIPDKGFTVACWFRHHGMGGLTDYKGRRAYYSGGIVAVGSGWWDGWRLAVTPKFGAASFGIGRPKIGAAMAAFRSGVQPGRWHHLAATWDRRHISLYLDGHLRAETPYNGPYTRSQPKWPLRIGEVGYGVGTLKLEVAELAIFGEALSPKTIARLANPAAAQTKAIIACLMRGDRAAKTGAGSVAEREQQARGEYSKVLALDASANPFVLGNYHAIARLRIAASFRREGKFDDARREAAALAGDVAAPLHYRARAMACIGDAFRDQRRYADARAAYERMRKFFTGKHENWRVEAIERLADVAGLEDGEPFRDARQRRIDRISHPARKFYVAPNGDDANPGTKDHPFRTLERARDAVRKLKAAGPLPQGGVAVYLRGGTYRRKATFELTDADAGTFAAPVIYQAFPGEKPVISGGIEVKGFRPVTAQDAPGRLPDAARAHVVALDLKKAGVDDFGSIKPRGFGLDPVPAHLELFFNGEPMMLARWPNPVGQVAKDFATIAGFDDGPVADFKGRQIGMGDGFRYSGSRPERWLAEPDIWIYAYWTRWYAGRYLRVSAIEPKRKIIDLSPPWSYHHARGYKHGGYLKGAPYFAVNLLCELDTPGEWYLDRGTGKLYFWPPACRDERGAGRPSPIAKGRAVVSMLEKPLIEAKRASHVVLRGLTFEAGRADGIIVEAGDDVILAGCIVHNMGNWGVKIDGGRDHAVVGCDIYNTGDGGVSLKGGDFKTLTPSGHIADNCHIHHVDRWNRAGYQPGIYLDGVGHRVSHCLFNDSPHQGIRVIGNDHVLEYTETHDTPYEAREMGMYYMYGRYRVLSERGNIARYCYFHHVPYTRALEKGFVGGGRVVFHIDHMNGGMTIYGNIFNALEAPSGAFFSGGRENKLENNIIYDSTAGIRLGDRSWVYGKEDRPPRYRYEAYLRKLHVDSPPWSVRYPDLGRIFERPREERPLPENNLIARNIGLKVDSFIWVAPLPLKFATIEHNLEGVDPGFVDAEKGDFAIRPDSEVFGEIGFDPIPVERIGLYNDELRATWPVLHKVDTHEHDHILRKPLDKLPTHVVPRRTAAITIDGQLEPAEWCGLKKDDAMLIDRSPNIGPSPAPPSFAWILHDDKALYIGILNEVNPRKPLTPHKASWWRGDMLEVIIEGQMGAGTQGWWPDEREHGPLFYLRADFRGSFDSYRFAGLPRLQAERLRRTVQYAARVVDASKWSAEFCIPLESICIDPANRKGFCFNIGVNKLGTVIDPSWPRGKRSLATWVAWVGTNGPNCEVWNAGRLVLDQ